MTNSEILVLFSLVKNYLRINANYLLTLVKECDMMTWYPDAATSSETDAQLKANMKEFAGKDLTQEVYFDDHIRTFQFVLSRQRQWKRIFNFLREEYSYEVQDVGYMNAPEGLVPLDVELELWQLVLEQPEIQENPKSANLIGQTIEQLQFYKMIKDKASEQ